MPANDEDGEHGYQRRAEDQTVKECRRDSEPPARVLDSI
jgi:hypothetical protein